MPDQPGVSGTDRVRVGEVRDSMNLEVEGENPKRWLLIEKTLDMVAVFSI